MSDDETGRTESGAADPAEPRPPLRLVRGDATPEEVAAVLAVLAAAAGGGAGAEPAPRHTSRWAGHEHGLRRPLTPGPGAWRASGWPH